MSTWILIWFIVAVITTTILLLCLLGLARHVVLLLRTAHQMQDEVKPIVDEVSREGQRASRRAASLQAPGRTHRS